MTDHIGDRDHFGDSDNTGETNTTPVTGITTVIHFCSADCIGKESNSSEGEFDTDKSNVQESDKPRSDTCQ